MTRPAVLFLVLSWGFVLGLMAWSFVRILMQRRHHDPDGTGPALPPEPPRHDRRT